MEDSVPPDAAELCLPIVSAALVGNAGDAVVASSWD